jgi:cyclohexanecarboxylate-CoA ligase
VCAVVVPDGEPPALDDLKNHLEAEQVTFENWPDRLEIVAALPKNSLGKILRAQLRQTIEGTLA